MFFPCFVRVFANEGELRGFLNLLFRFFSKGGWGSRSSHTNFLSNLLETKTFFTIFFWIPELSFTRALLQHALWLLLVFFWFLQVLVLLSLDFVVYSCSELLLLYYCVGRCFLDSLSEKKETLCLKVVMRVIRGKKSVSIYSISDCSISNWL